jgi:hypothetical protein
VVIGGGSPASAGVTGTTKRTEVSDMGIILLVAGIAIAGGTLEDMIDMAKVASHIGMFSG